jgi:hypothetical protein
MGPHGGRDFQQPTPRSQEFSGEVETDVLAGWLSI